MMRATLTCGVLLVAVMAAGCALPSGRRMAALPVTIEGGIVRIGAALPLEPGPGLGEADVILAITNTATHATITRRIPRAEVATTVIRVDPTDLPGLDPQGADLQTFKVQLGHGGTQIETEVTVLFDETARMPPSVPLGKAPIIGNVAGYTVDTEELASAVVAAWEGTVRCQASRVVELAELDLHPNVRERIPAGAPLREFTVQGAFPRRIVDAPWAPPGVGRKVVTPTALRFVIAETAPSHLVTLLALEASDAPQVACP